MEQGGAEGRYVVEAQEVSKGDAAREGMGEARSAIVLFLVAGGGGGAHLEWRREDGRSLYV